MLTLFLQPVLYHFRYAIKYERGKALEISSPMVIHVTTALMFHTAVLFKDRQVIQQSVTERLCQSVF